MNEHYQIRGVFREDCPVLGRLQRGCGQVRALGRGLVLAALVAVTLSSSDLRAQAQPESPLEVNLVVLKPSLSPEGKETLVPSPEAEPGQTLVYRVTYTNRGKSELGEVVASVPVPAGLVFVEDSAKPAPARASVDGKTFFDVAQPPAGVLPAAWKVVRWNPRDLPPGAEFVVEIRARVLSTTGLPAR